MTTSDTTSNEDVPIDRRQHSQRLMPPGTEHIVRLDVFLLIVGSLFLALVERLLQPNVRLDLALRGLETDEPSDVECVLDLDLDREGY